MQKYIFFLTSERKKNFFFKEKCIEIFRNFALKSREDFG